MTITARFDSFEDVATDEDAFLADVVAGLSAMPKTLPCKYFYDETGSKLFDRICEVPEYYPTRTEIALMGRYAGEIAAAVGPEAELIEYGSGASKKVRILLDALERPAAYVAVDISRDFLVASTEPLVADYPALAIHVLCADFTRPFDLPPEVAGSGRRAVGFFPGSTIGNFGRDEARDFLANCADTLGAGGGMLIGVDLKKDPAVLEAAYDDAGGVTAAFNLNLLTRINRELGGDFDLDRFAHRARYNGLMGRVEMHLESLADQTVSVGGHGFAFEEGETIHTESSHKYEVGEFQAMAAAAGFAASKVWTDADDLFSVHFLEVT